MNENNNNTPTRPVPKRHNVYCGNSLNKHNRLGTGSYRLNPELTPLNTGKVLIGSAYQPSLKKLHSTDQEWLQGMLLNHQEPAVKPLSDTVLWWLYGAAIVVLALTA